MFLAFVLKLNKETHYTAHYVENFSFLQSVFIKQRYYKIKKNFNINLFVAIVITHFISFRILYTITMIIALKLYKLSEG